MRLGWLVAVAACSYEPARQDVDAAPPVDAFVPARDCPADYVVMLPDQSSRYRVIVDGAKAWEHSDDCNDDKAGATHLVAIDDQAELDAIEARLNVAELQNDKAWIGGVQRRTQPAPRVGWLSVTGGELFGTAWNPGEPNDNDNIESSQENFVGIEQNRQGLVDFPSDDDLGGMCECDGKPIDLDAAAAIDASRE